MAAIRKRTILPRALPLALILFVVIVFTCGCFANDAKSEQEFSRGYEAGKAASEAKAMDSTLAGKKAQEVLASIGEGRAARIEITQYAIEDNTCQAYGKLVMQDQSVREITIRMEKTGDIWQITGLDEPGVEENAG
jgi:pectate lyase